MERMTIPDVMIDEKTTRRTIIDASEVRKHAMEFYWRLKSIEDILGDDYDLDRLRELVQADRDGRCSISPKLICIDEVTTPTPEQYRWMMGRFLKGEQDG